jgi:hypothetical protein
MQCEYVIQPGDTFEKIAVQFYNNPELAEKLRHYNGLYNSDFIIIGQPIDIPLSADLHADAPLGARKPDGMQPPHGIQQVVEMFGNIYDYVDEDGCFDEYSWNREMLTMTQLPFPVALSWDRSLQTRRVRCHKKMAGVITDAFCTIEREGFADEVITVGDFYNFRSKRSCGKLSLHCWGIAIDVNPETNRLASKGSMPQELVMLLREFGFTWGGDFRGKYRDTMHFQFCTGY